MTMKRTTIWLDDEIDAQAIQTISVRYGCESGSQAMRLALRVLANSPILEIQLPERPRHAQRPSQADPTAAIVAQSAYAVLQELQPAMLGLPRDLFFRRVARTQRHGNELADQTFFNNIAV